MALFHSTTKIISRSDGGNAVAAASYRSGTRMTCERTGQVFNYTRKKEVTYRVILAPPNSPDWVKDRAKLANAIEARETRANSQLWREVEMALPLALNPEQQIKLLNEYVQTQFVERGMVCDVCRHHKKGNPHAHLLLTLRDIAPDGFGAKRRDWNDKALVTQWREAWATACNSALEQAGSTERIDHRSNKARGITDLPTVHLGRRTPANAEAWDARADFNAWVQTSIELAKVQAEVRRVESQIVDLTTTISQALAERDAKRVKGAFIDSAVVPRVWTPGNQLPRQDFSIAGILSRRQAAATVAQRSTRFPHAPNQSTPSPDASHGPDDFQKGDKPC